MYGGFLGRGFALEATDNTPGGPVTVRTTQAAPPGARIVLVVTHVFGVAAVTVTGGLAWATDGTFTDGTNELTILGARAPAGLDAGVDLEVSFGAARPFWRTISAHYLTGIDPAAPVLGSDGASIASYANPNGPWAQPLTVAEASDLVAVTSASFRTSAFAPNAESVELDDYAGRDLDPGGPNLSVHVVHEAAPGPGTYNPGGTIVAGGSSGQRLGVAYKLAPAGGVVIDAAAALELAIAPAAAAALEAPAAAALELAIAPAAAGALELTAAAQLLLELDLSASATTGILQLLDAAAALELELELTAAAGFVFPRRRPGRALRSTTGRVLQAITGRAHRSTPGS